MKRIELFRAVIASAAILMVPAFATATNLIGLKVIDKDYLMLHFRDGEVRYRDNGTGPSAYLGHSFAEGDDTLAVFGQRLDTEIAGNASGWKISSTDDKAFRNASPLAVWRKSKPMNTDHTLKSELDHWIFLQLPKSMKQGCSYTVKIPSGIGSDTRTASIRFDVWNNQSEAVHVNIIGYSPDEKLHAADLYQWLGDGGGRDYSGWEGLKVWLYNVETKEKKEAGAVRFWKSSDESGNEAGGKNLIGTDVWNADFAASEPGRYRIVIEDVGCSMDFDIRRDVFHLPYKYSVRGYYYMRLGEPAAPEHVFPVPRQPRFIPGEDPEGFVIYKTDLHPWSEDWRKLRGDVWDEPHFKPAERSEFWKHRIPGNPLSEGAIGGHSDAFDWDRHLAHVSNIYDLLLPYLLTEGRLDDDDLGIRESGNGIPDIIDEARNEVDFFLSIRDGEGYSQGVTNPSMDWKVMFQAGCTTMAAWANAANCAILADAFRISGNRQLMEYYTAEAIKAFRFAGNQENQQLDDQQLVGNMRMKGCDFRQMAAAFLYNLTGETAWEDIMAEEPLLKESSEVIWAAAACLICPNERHFGEMFDSLKEEIRNRAGDEYVSRAALRPSRRAANDARWQVSENLQMVMLAHYISDAAERAFLESVMMTEAGWGLGRNPGNIVEMTGLGERHITDCYSTGRNDGYPGTHPGQTPFNGTETWSAGDGGDARILTSRCYPSWNDGGWPRQESYFNQRYLWVNGEFTPRETMRGKMALLGYLAGIK